MIEVTQLRKDYDGLAALAGVDFRIEKGEIVGFLGPNGAGKTTTMKILTGFIAPSGGRAVINGVDVLEDPVAARRQIGYLPENAPIYPDMVVEDYLDYVGRVRGLATAELEAAKVRAIEAVGLQDRRQQVVGTLSKGYRQRVGLAQAILHDPEILILDEPTSGLDPNQIFDIRRLIRELGERKTVILSTHILSEVQATCDRVLIVNKGRIVADGPTATVTARGQGEVVHLSVVPGDVRPSPEAILAAVKGVAGVQEVRALPSTDGLEGELSMEVHSEADIRPALARSVQTLGVLVVEIRRDRSNLEDVFRRLTQDHPAPQRPA